MNTNQHITFCSLEYWHLIPKQISSNNPKPIPLKPIEVVSSPSTTMPFRSILFCELYLEQKCNRLSEFPHQDLTNIYSSLTHHELEYDN